MLEAEDYDLAEDSLFHFTRAAWPVVEGGRKFKANWHHRAICDHLEAVTRGEITRLIINVPPRSTKSTIVSVMWPAWVWIKEQNKQFLTGSHAAPLAIRDALKTRRLVNSPWYQKRWPQVQFTGDQNQKTRYELKGGGHRIIFGMGSGVIGEGGDYLVIDDPHPGKDGMWSEANRRAAAESYDQELSTRLNDPENSAVVIIMQRLHQNDLSGHVMAKEPGRWVHLRLPMEFEPEDPCCTVLGFRDPRTEPGEILQPERFSPAWLAAQKRLLGTYGVAGQLQQRPAPMEGGIIQIGWFRRYRELPSRDQWIEVVQFWDTAQKANELLNCPWVCGTWIQTRDNRLYLKDVYRQWMDYPTGKRMAVSLWDRERPQAVVIEDKSTGSSLIQEVRGKIPVLPFEPEGDKVTRLATESPAIEAGTVWLPESAPWLPDFETELGSFPASATMDQADMLSMALKFFRERRGQGQAFIPDVINF
ncbi:MAG: phage terminase large subunit [Deltaproteobacteria bacterium]|nr:phage terminase large subunit [Deltaproteobacteria bacterium]